ncbi:hypothetical protein DYY67_1246 [Candidatus Nitrosotalea sp. TS]|uniref:class I SAM-dependent methyltransferase n=1 Tax=Candidatus Nitrosotalea sp. TS TaxID=2341020 RepID=UPI00140C525D|nr:class I SAM-dependent methyltransferase [Candidatus Nitrosotalea sp. TS]NHI04388.1 hypothetical protein [Candidatus Nitrosotalea sp. TS]
MPDIKTQEHNKNIISQFTKQAVPFTKKMEHSHEGAFRLMVKVTGVTKDDTVLDVACGSGLVSCALAGIVNHVTGIDITPAMIEQAKLLQNSKKLENLTWKIGDVTSLPFENDSFSLVITRYSFHHMMDPISVLSEMKRVCKPGGRIAVIDVTPDKDKADRYNKMEKLRDPSHAKALTINEFESMFNQLNIAIQKTESYGLEMDLEGQLKASFPNPGDEVKIREMFEEDLKSNNLGVNSSIKNNKIYFQYPTSIMMGHKQ